MSAALAGAVAVLDGEDGKATLEVLDVEELEFPIEVLNEQAPPKSEVMARHSNATDRFERFIKFLLYNAVSLGRSTYNNVIRYFKSTTARTDYL